MLCFQPMFVFSDTGLFISWPHKLFLSIHKNKFQPPQVHRFYALKSKEISTEWKYNILKIYWKYSITIHGKCPKCKEDRGINLSWAEVFSAINPFLTSGDNRSHILETHLQQIFSGLFCVTFLLRLISVPPLFFQTNKMTIIHDANGLSVKGVWSPSIKIVSHTWPHFTFLWRLHWTEFNINLNLTSLVIVL